jgi:hypothetical protein
MAGQLSHTPRRMDGLRPRTIAAVLLLLTLTACDALQVPTPAPTPVATPTGSSASAPPTATPGPTATPVPTTPPTPSPTPTASPSPTPTPSPTLPPATDWTAPLLIDAAYAPYVSLAVDAQGHTHVAASDLNSVYYLTDSSGAWSRTLVATPPAGGADIEPVIALAPDGSLAIAFTRWSVWPDASATLGEIEGIYFVRQTEQGWSDPSQLPGFGQQPALVFWNGSWNIIARQFDGLFWYRRDGADWPGRNIGDRGSGGAQMVVDGQGVAHVVYAGANGLIEVTRDGTLTDQPVPGTDGGQHPLLAVDGAGNVHLLYSDGVGQVLERALEGGAWSAPEQLDVGGADAFGIDAAGNLQLVYLRRTASPQLVYSTVAAGSTATAELASVATLPRPAGAPALVLDGAGQPHVVYSTLGDGLGTYVRVGPAL